MTLFRFYILTCLGFLCQCCIGQNANKVFSLVENAVSTMSEEHIENAYNAIIQG